jgi:hypothetical protein
MFGSTGYFPGMSLKECNQPAERNRKAQLRTDDGANSGDCICISLHETFITIGFSRSPCGQGEIAEYEMCFEFLLLVEEGTLLQVEYIFSIGTANHPSRSATSATGPCQKLP